MKKLKKILRFRFDDETIDALNKVKRKSDFVRLAVREKLEREKFIKPIKLPF